MSIDETFHGDLQGHSVGQMMAFQSPAKGSAAYVALEQVTGSLQGRQGSFVLQHMATMDAGTPSMRILVEPDSGTGRLTGLSGTLAIEIAPDGKHNYVFEYQLREPR